LCAQRQVRTIDEVKVAAMLDLLRADGRYVVAIRGTHRQLRHATKRGKVTVAGKPSDELHPKTAASILWQAGLRR
jgi:predicted RNA binding protein YcfA (HicA-like mRNA interferase family)